MTEELCPNQGEGPPPAADAEALAARPLLEQVARMGDCIGQQTVGQIVVLSERAAAWLRENPPGQPVAIEPRGCPTPGACSCVAPAPPAAGEVAELVKWLRETGDMIQPSHLAEHQRYNRAAELLERQQAGDASDEELIQSYQAGRRDAEADAQQAAEAAGNVPAAGEVAELVAELFGLADYFAGEGYSSNWITRLRRAAELLERQYPQPVPVSERLPGVEDCDAEGRCWVHQPHEACPESPAWELMLAKYASANYGAVYWLPANALPLPS